MSNANEPAYPILLHEGEELPGGVEPSGITKREHFAAMAMQGFLACPGVSATNRHIAIGSVACADELLAALEEPK